MASRIEDYGVIGNSRTVGFLPAQDPRVQSTVAAVERALLRDGFVLRYVPEHGIDGLPGTEGAFLACSFWLADNYASRAACVRRRNSSNG